jgi:hypothetical protein
VGIELSEEQIIEPAANALTITKIIDQQAMDLLMDVEPSNFTKLLHDLAPIELRRNEEIDE